MEFDEEDKPKEVSKPRRFAPARAGKSKPKPKPEPTTEPPSQTAPPPPLSKSEDHDVDAKFASPKVETEVYNGAVKMEIDSKLDNDPETTTTMTEVEFMEEDHLPLQEEDVVVREIDVFFNPSIDNANTKLYVLHYPLRPSWRPYEMDERCQEVRVNPSTSQVEIDLSIMDSHSKNYDSEFGHKLKLTKQTLTTTWKQPPSLDYAVGVLSGDKLHLNPVHAVAQLRPSIQYLSSKDQKPNQEENWIALKYHGLESELCFRYLKGMMTKGNSSIDFNMSLDGYINSLCRGERSRISALGDPLKRVLTSLPLKELVQKLLCEGPPLHRYRVLKHYSPDSSDEDFLGELRQYGWLVQGLWTPKTSLLKLEGPLEASRDYVLSLFNKDSVIKYSQVEATGRLRDKVKTMLNVFAKERPLLSDWKFKEPTDVSFIKSYPEIAEEQNIFWNAKYEKLKTMITQGGKSRANTLRNVS